MFIVHYIIKKYMIFYQQVFKKFFALRAILVMKKVAKLTNL